MRLMPTALPRTIAQDDPAPGVVIVTVPDTAEGQTLCIGRFDTVVGPVIAIGAGGTLWALGLAAEMGEDAVRADLSARWPGAHLVEAPEALAPAVAVVTAGRGEVRVRLVGTPFQLKVWRALLDVPPGQVTSYGALATAIGSPGAARAVGTAVGQNPVAWVVPCHRVTRASGEAGGFHWGATVKAALLAYEQPA